MSNDFANPGQSVHTVCIERQSKLSLSGWRAVATMPLADAAQFIADNEAEDWNKFGHYAPSYRIAGAA